MPQLLALEWNRREVRVAVASGRGRRIVLEHAFSIPCREEESAEDSSDSSLGKRIAEALDARGIGRPEALVAIGRSAIELRQLQFPPAPDEELPAMVRFQATREFNEFDDRWLLDFVPIDRQADGPRTVLATAVAPATVARIEAVCEHAGLKMRRLLLRPCAAASLLASATPASAGSLRLLVELLSEEADLTATIDGKTVYMRTTRVSDDRSALPGLLAEIRLTMAAVRNQFTGQEVSSIVLCGEEPVHAELAQGVEANLGMLVELFDPFADIELGPALHASLPEHPGRFAAVLGMLSAELRQTGQAIDFLHPRRRAEPPNRKRQRILAAVAVAVIPLLCFGYMRFEKYRVGKDVQSMSSQLKTLEIALTSGRKIRAQAADIAKWTDGEVVWLDQLNALSQSFPPAPDAMLGQLTLAVRRGGSQMDIKGWVRGADVIAKMEERVRERSGQISGKSSREDRSVRPYSWRFEATVLLENDVAKSNNRNGDSSGKTKKTPLSNRSKS